MAHDIFISYSSKNKTIADAVCATLENAGIRCWIAPRDVTPGAVWAVSITGAIETSSIMVLIFSSHVNNSSHVMSELELAVNNSLVILPFRIEDIEPSAAIGFFVRTSHWLDALTEPMDQHLEKLAKSVQAIVHSKGQPDENNISSTYAAHRNMFSRSEEAIPSVQEQDYAAAVRASNTAHVLRDRVADVAQFLSQRIARADRRESNILEQVQVFFRDHIISSKDFLDIEIDIRSGDAMLVDRQYSKALESFKKVQQTLNRLNMKVGLEESRARLDAKFSETFQEFDNSGLQASDALLSAQEIFIDAQQRLKEEQFDEASKKFKVATANCQQAYDEISKLLAHKQEASLEEQLRHITEHCTSLDLPLPVELETTFNMLLSGKTKNSNNDFDGAAADFESASHSLSEANTLAHDLEKKKQSATELLDTAISLAIKVRKLCGANDFLEPEDLAEVEQVLESGRRMHEKQDFLAATDDFQIAIHNLNGIFKLTGEMAESRHEAIDAEKITSSAASALQTLCSPNILAKNQEVQEGIGELKRGKVLLKQQNFESARLAFKNAEKMLNIQLAKARLLKTAQEAEKAAFGMRKKTARRYSKHKINKPKEFHEAQKKLSSTHNKLLQEQDLEETIHQLRHAEQGFKDSFEKIQQAEWILQIEQSSESVRKEIAETFVGLGLVETGKFLEGVSMLEEGRNKLHICDWDNAATDLKQAEQLFQQAERQIAELKPLLDWMRSTEDELQETIQAWETRAQKWGVSTSLSPQLNDLIYEADLLKTKGNYLEASTAFEQAVERLRTELTKASRTPVGCDVVNWTPSETGWAMEVIDPRNGVRFRLIEAGQFMMGSLETEYPNNTWCEEEINAHSSGKAVTNIATEPNVSQFWVRVRESRLFGLIGSFIGNRNPSNQKSPHKHSEYTLVREDELPQHQVNIKNPFYLAVIPTTQKQWDQKPSSPKKPIGELAQLDLGACESNNSQEDSPKIPKTQVDWNEAWEFCQFYGYRLPTEAEWEFACRAGSPNRRYGDLDEIAWHSENSFGRVHQAAKKQPNSWGLYDMLGNISEWCSDAYAKDTYKEPSRNDPFVFDGDRQVRRGGSFSESPVFVRSAFRRSSPAKDKRNDVGFRCVKSTLEQAYQLASIESYPDTLAKNEKEKYREKM